MKVVTIVKTTNNQGKACLRCMVEFEGGAKRAINAVVNDGDYKSSVAKIKRVMVDELGADEKCVAKVDELSGKWMAELNVEMTAARWYEKNKAIIDRYAELVAAEKAVAKKVKEA